jgi:ribonuclease J
VIFSSRAIPGNEKAVAGIINGLVTQGIEVITDRTHLVHVSGHPRRGELEQLLRWVRPQIVLPVHGEALHMAEHADLARCVGVPKVITCEDGDLLRLAPEGPAVIDEVPSGRFYKDGSLLVDAQARTVPDRRRLAFAGIVSVALAMTEKGELAADPEIELTGIPETNARGKAIGDIVADAVMEALDSMPRARRRDPAALAESISRAVRGTLGREWGKKPTCHVHVLTV